MQVKKLIDSFNHAIEGIIFGLKTQRNMKIHFAAAIVVLLTAMLLHIDKIQIIILLLTITMVIVAELINTAVEAVVDMVSPKYHPLARAAKNVAAGAVLVTAVNAIVVGYLVFYDSIAHFSFQMIYYIKQLPVHLTFISLVVVVFGVIIVKALSHRGTFMKGGLPSGHSALAFSLFTSAALISGNALIATLCFGMALLVVQSRLESGIHTMFEIVIGGLLGVLITLLVFQLSILPM